MASSSSSSSSLHLDSNDLLFKTLPTKPRIMRRKGDVYAACVCASSPGVAIDNKADTTVIRVNSANRQGCLLRIVQLLTEADLNVHKAFITSDGYWFVDDFRVTGPTGCKIENPDSMKQIEQLLEERSDPQVDEWGRASILGRHDFVEYTTIEVTGRDRVGLLREIMSVLARVDVTIADATVWTNFGRMACVLYVMDANTEQPILDERRLGAIQELVSTVMEADDAHESRTTLTPLVRWKGQTWTERRLHQMMFDDRDFVSPHLSECGQLTSPVLMHKSPRSVSVKVENVPDYQYTMISVKSSDRARVLFDTVCTLADMEYDICHAYLKAEDGVCDQEYFIKTLEGKMVTMKTEHVFLEKCLEAAIRRRDCQGVRLELNCPNRMGLLLEVTRNFAINGLTVTHGHLSVMHGEASAYFYVADASGGAPNPRLLEQVIEAVKPTSLRIAPEPSPRRAATSTVTEGYAGPFSLNALQERGKVWLCSLAGGIFGQISTGNSFLL